MIQQIVHNLKIIDGESIIQALLEISLAVSEFSLFLNGFFADDRMTEINPQVPKRTMMEVTMIAPKTIEAIAPEGSPFFSAGIFSVPAIFWRSEEFC